jgi:hypothetical protein
MSLAGDDQMNEVARKLDCSEGGALEDIYVPGIGVRDALSDDGEGRSDLGSAVGERCARGAALVSRWAIRTFGNVRRFGSRLAVSVTKINIRLALRYRLKSLAQLTNSRSRDLQPTQRRFPNSMRSAVSTFRGATRKKTAFFVPPIETMNRISQNARSRLLRVAEIVRAQGRRAGKYRMSLPAVSLGVDRNLRRGQSFLRTAAISSKNRLLTSTNYKALFRVSASYKPDLPALRRAAAPLAILLVMMVFVIQEVVTALKR